MLVSPTHFFKSQCAKRIFGGKAVHAVIPFLIQRRDESEVLVSSVTKPFVLFLGRSESHKGLSILIQAWKQIRAPWTLVVAGTGQQRFPLTDGIVSLGEVSAQERDWLFAQCEFFCMPSTNESFGLVYIEAMRAQKAVIAVKTPPIDEIVVDKTTGLLIDTVESDVLANALKSLISDSGLRHAMGIAGYERYIACFSEEKSIGEYVRAFEGAVARGRKNLKGKL